MREFERAGVSAVQLEDQEWPKKCGHEPGRKVASSTEMEQRIKAAADARVDADVMIVARTDAIASEGFEAALERAARYREAGADILFVEAPPSEADLAQVPKRLGVPCLANMVEGGRTPVLPFPQAGAARLQGRDLSQFADAAVRARRPGPAGLAQEHRQHGRHGQPDARPWPALVAVRERALAGAGEALPGPSATVRLTLALADMGDRLDLDQDLGRGQRAHLDQGRGREVAGEELARAPPTPWCCS